MILNSTIWKHMFITSCCQERSEFLTGKPIMRGALLTLAEKVAKSLTILENQIWARWLPFQIQNIFSWRAWIEILWRKNDKNRFFILFRARVHSYFVWLCASRLTGFALTGSIKRILCCFHWMYSVGSCSCVDVPFTPSYAVVKRNKLIACSVSHVSSWFLSTFLLDVLNVFCFYCAFM